MEKYNSPKVTVIDIAQTDIICQSGYNHNDNYKQCRICNHILLENDNYCSKCGNVVNDEDNSYIIFTFKKSPKVPLYDCPIGLFIFKGVVCLKTEYSTKYDDGYHNDVYICSTGETFWGGTNDIITRDALYVTPLN